MANVTIEVPDIGDFQDVEVIEVLVNPGDAVETDASLITPPMVTASRGHKVSLTARVNAGVPLEIIASRYHPVSVSETNGQYEVALKAGQAAMDHDFELVWQPTPSAAPRALAFTETIDGRPYHLLMVMPPDEAPPLGRQVDAARGVEQHVAVDRDPAGIGPQQPGQHVDERRLAGAG